jgi:hypothetical protein
MRAGREVHQCPRVRLDAEVDVLVAVDAAPVHPRPAVADRHPVCAELLHVEHVRHRSVDLRRRAGQRHEDQASRELRVLLGHPVQRGPLTVGLGAH